MTVILDYKEFVFGTEKLMCMLWSGCTMYILTQEVHYLYNNLDYTIFVSANLFNRINAQWGKNFFAF